MIPQRQSGPQQTRAARPSLYSVTIQSAPDVAFQELVDLLQTHFERDPGRAESLAMEVELDGFAVCGTYPFDVAETKAIEFTSDAFGRGVLARLTVDRA